MFAKKYTFKYENVLNTTSERKQMKQSNDTKPTILKFREKKMKIYTFR